LNTQLPASAPAIPRQSPVGCHEFLQVFNHRLPQRRDRSVFTPTRAIEPARR
jgi:hypothetical protein